MSARRELVLDARRVALWAVTALFVVPAVIIALCGSGLSALAKLMLRARDAMGRWANPDVHGTEPKRLRRLFYSRRTVRRLVEQIDYLKAHQADETP
jgi:hypothetical protein